MKMAYPFLASARPRLFVSAFYEVPKLRPRLLRTFSCTLLSWARARVWTQDELDTVQKLLKEDREDRYIASLLGRTAEAVKAQRLQLRRHGKLLVAEKPPVYWTKQEDDRLQHLRAKGSSWESIAADLNRSRAAVQIRFARVSGTYTETAFERIPRRQWSRSDLMELKELSDAGLTQREMAKRLNVSYGSIAYRLARLDMLDKRNQSRHDYTKDEDQQISELRSQGLTWSEISAKFPNRSAVSLKDRYCYYLSPKGRVWSKSLLSKQRKFWTKQDDAAFSDYIRQGLSNEEISDRLDRSLLSIKVRRYDLEKDRKYQTGKGTDEQRSGIEGASSSGTPASAPKSSIGAH